MYLSARWFSCGALGAVWAEASCGAVSQTAAIAAKKNRAAQVVRMRPSNTQRLTPPPRARDIHRGWMRGCGGSDAGAARFACGSKRPGGNHGMGGAMQATLQATAIVLAGASLGY